MSKKHEYYIHEVFNGNKRVCDACFKVSRRDYMCWEDFFLYDCIDETITTKENIMEHHLYLDAGDTDDPAEVVTRFYDYTC